MPEQMTKQDAIETLEIFRNDYTREGSSICQAINLAIDALRQPTIESEPGRWVQCDALDYEDPNGVMHVHGMCSCCLRIYDFKEMTSRFKFCPDCGTRMNADHIADASKKV